MLEGSEIDNIHELCPRHLQLFLQRGAIITNKKGFFFFLFKFSIFETQTHNNKSS